MASDLAASTRWLPQFGAALRVRDVVCVARAVTNHSAFFVLACPAVLWSLKLNSRIPKYNAWLTQRVCLFSVSLQLYNINIFSVSILWIIFGFTANWPNLYDNLPWITSSYYSSRFYYVITVHKYARVFSEYYARTSIFIRHSIWPPILQWLFTECM